MIFKKYITISIIARTGFVAKGIVYFMVGLLTLLTTIGLSGETSDSTDVFQELIDQPFGWILLIGIIIGLIAHAVWKMLQGVLDPEGRGDGMKIIFLRVVDFLTGCLYIGLSYAAWQILQGLGAEDGDESTEVWIGKILDLPYGDWLVFIIAIAIFLGGIYQFYSAWLASFESSFSSSDMTSKEQSIMRVLGRIGTSAWGVVYLMLSFLLYKASASYDSDEAGGLSEALESLGELPFGTWVLGITAAGLIIYGLFLIILSYYYKITSSNKGSKNFQGR